MEDKQITLLENESGMTMKGYGLSFTANFSSLLRRVAEGRIFHEMLIKAAKTKKDNPRAIDATAGMGEDSFLLAAYGYEVTMIERNPLIVKLLEDALKRAEEDESLLAITSRMKLIEGDSIEFMNNYRGELDLIYLDPMFPARNKSGLVNKKLQLIQKLEMACEDEDGLFNAAYGLGPEKIVVKRSIKSPYLAGRRPTYSLSGKTIRYDCYQLSGNRD